MTDDVLWVQMAGTALSIKSKTRESGVIDVRVYRWGAFMTLYELRAIRCSQSKRPMTQVLQPFDGVGHPVKTCMSMNGAYSEIILRKAGFWEWLKWQLTRAVPFFAPATMLIKAL